MFFDVDERRFVAVAVGSEAEHEIELPAELEDAAERAAALPTAGRLRSIADALAAEPPPGARAVRVEVWETRFGPEFEPVRRRLGEAQVEVRPRGS